MPRLLTDLCPLLCLLLLRAGSVAAGHDPTFCAISPPSGVLMPAAPIIYNVALSMVDSENIRSSAFEYFDGSQQKSSFQAFTPEGSFRTVVNYITNQVQVINMSNTGNVIESCQVQNISAGDILTQVTLGTRNYFLPSKFFFGGSGVNIEALPDDTINGIAVKSYLSCYYAASTDRSLKINWYFTSGPRPEPRRVIVDVKDNTKGSSFKITHEISRFGPGGPGLSARFNPFMAPPGLYCRNLNSQGRKPMTMPNKFSLRIEQVGLGTAIYMREAYDLNANMSMLVINPPSYSSDSAKFGAGRLLYIHDFGRGLSYIRNEDMGNCTFERLSVADWDSQKDGNRLRIRSPREVFDLDSDNVQYKGTGYTRDILTDIFINYKLVNLPDSDKKGYVTFEWYFANRTVVDTKTNQSVNVPVPMSLLYSSDESWTSSWNYIYDFDQNEQVFNRHDIASCFSNDAKKHFQLYFPLPANETVIRYIRKNPNGFTSLLVPIISTGLNVSPLRVLDPEVTVSGSSAILELTVTDKPSFQTNAEETPLNEVEAAMNILVNGGNVFTTIEVGKDFYVFVMANKVSLVEERTNNLKSIGYSAGAVAGAAIGLLLAGLLAGLVAAFLYWR